ncbi:hypothetical protein ACA910_004510 [Epithemia clementina (nom. ined.)]
MMSSFHSSNIKKKMAIEEAVGSKPKRPLSVYNYFFQEERKKLLLTLPIRSQGKPRHSHAPLEVVYNTSDCGNSLLSSCFGSLSPTSIFASCPAADAPAAPAAAHQRAHQNHNQIIATNPDHQSERNTRASCYANPMMDQLTDNLGEEGVLLFTELFRNIPTSS